MFPITHLETCLIDQITDRDKGLLKGRLVAHEELLKNPDQMEMLDQPVNGKTSDHRKPEASISSEREYISELTDDVNEATTDAVPFKPQLVWKNIILFAILHIGGFWGLWQIITLQVRWQTILNAYIVGWLTVEATMVGAHRFYSHKTFKGTYWFRLLIVLTQAMAGQNSIYIWARDHRLHHKYSDTDADPHNSQRGFFFCHMGWLMQRKHPMVKIKGKTIDMSDLQADQLVQFQRKYYYFLYALLAFALPVYVPVYFWGETQTNSILVCYFLRYMISLHGTWTVNSFAHLYGYRPYTKDIQPVESEFVAFISSGEGWHNYHHTFPWDYRAGEFGKKWNLSSKIVDWFAAIGMVYDRKFATPEMVRHRVLKRGDGSHPLGSDLHQNGETLLDHHELGHDDKSW